MRIDSLLTSGIRLFARATSQTRFEFAIRFLASYGRFAMGRLLLAGCAAGLISFVRVKVVCTNSSIEVVTNRRANENVIVKCRSVARRKRYCCRRCVAFCKLGIVARVNWCSLTSQGFRVAHIAGPRDDHFYRSWEDKRL